MRTNFDLIIDKRHPMARTVEEGFDSGDEASYLKTYPRTNRNSGTCQWALSMRHRARRFERL